MTPRPPAPHRAVIDDWTHDVLLAYRGESDTDVLRQAVLLKATADGKVDAGGRLRGGADAWPRKHCGNASPHGGHRFMKGRATGLCPGQPANAARRQT